MGKKFIILFFGLFFLISCTKEKSNYNIKPLKLKKIKSIISPIDFLGDVYAKGSDFIIADYAQNRIIVIDINGKIIKTIGRKGKGPNEFSGLYRLIYNDKTFMAFDYKLNRLTLYDSLLNYKNSFVTKTNSDENAIKYGNKIITIGRRVTKYNLTFDNYKIGDLYEKKNKYWIFKKRIINVTGFNVNLLKYPFIPKISTLRIMNKIYILHSFLDKVIIYDIKKDTTFYKSFYYPSYKSFENLKNVNSLYKKYSRKFFRNTSDFCSSPIAFYYNYYKHIFLAEFLEPFQNWYENEMNGKTYFKYSIILFDKNFRCLSSIKTNQYILGIDIKSDRFIIYTTEIFHYYIGEEEPDTTYLNVYEIDLSSY